MALITVRPTAADVAIANFVATHTNPPAEEAAEVLTWGADEHILCGLTAAWWLYTRNQNRPIRRAADYILLTTFVASALPHLLKILFDQPRPDRLTVGGHWRGVPLSGRRFDAFPSGNAVHVGALASAASRLPRRQRNIAWLVSAGRVVTRIILLAHWTSDVLAGLAIGALTERSLRRFTDYSWIFRRALACLGCMVRIPIVTSGWHYDPWRGPFFSKGSATQALAPVLRQPISNLQA
jgi:undecaprenyl-diphosphatase